MRCPENEAFGSSFEVVVLFLMLPVALPALGLCSQGWPDMGTTQPRHQPLYFISLLSNITVRRAELNPFFRIAQGHAPLRSDLGSDSKVHVASLNRGGCGPAGEL